MTRIAFLGAGSVRFTRKLVGDLLQFPELRTASLALHDIDVDRLETARRAVEGVGAAMNATPAIHATLDRRAALLGADFVINLVQVGGFDATLLDFEVPRRYGVRYAINDTINAGGVMRGLRTIPVFLDILREMRDVCPSAWMLNYANPMAMVVGASSCVGGDRVVGLCHSVSNTINQLADYVGVPASEVWYESAGLNHLAFITRFERNGIDLYPKLWQVAQAAGIPDTDLVRADLFMRFGLYPTESSEHHSDYNPWFIPKQLIERFHIPLDELLRRDRANVEEFKKLQEGGSESVVEAPAALSGEYAAPIIHAIVGGSPVRVIGNVLNTNELIANLPKGICVSTRLAWGAFHRSAGRICRPP
jgi:alpha-galactosidase